MQALKDAKWASAGRAAGQNPNGASGVLVDLIALTNDAGLIAQTQDASAGRHILWQATSAEEAVEHLVAGRCGVLLADLQVLRGNAKVFFERLHQQFPSLVLIAAGGREEEGEVAQLITAGAIYRFLHKPLSPGRTQQFVSAATRRYHEINVRATPTLTSVADFAREQMSPALLRNAAIGIVAVSVIGAGVVLFDDAREMFASSQQDAVGAVVAPAPASKAASAAVTPKPSPVPTKSPVHSDANALTASVAATPIVPAAKSLAPQVASSPIEAMLKHAMLAIDEARLASPPGNNALELVRQAQAVAPDDSRLLITATALGQRLLVESNAALARNDARAAEEWFAMAQSLDADLRLYLPEMQATRAALDARTQQARDDEMRMLVGIATERREAGLLIEPQGASAYDQISLLRDRDPTSTLVAAEAERLSYAMIERAKASLTRNDLTYSRRLLTSIESLTPELAAAQPVHRELAFAEKQSEALREPIAANNLRRLVEVAPEYPLIARERGIEGWAEVEFTIERDGSVTSPLVRAAEPMDMFNKAAVDAVERWRFETVVFDGRPLVQRAYLRLTFKLR